MRQTPISRPFALPAGALVLCLGLTGCSGFSDSKYNPANWFGNGSKSAPVLYSAPPDKRLLVAQVLTLKIEKTSDGAIVRASGLPPSQGWWRASLVKLEQDDTARLAYEFRVFPPLTPTPASTPQSREIDVAVALTNQQLDGITTITVQGAGNTLSARR